MSRTRLLLTVLALVSAMLTADSALAKRKGKGPKCFPREGHCVSATVNGQSPIPVSKPTRKLLKQLEDVSHYADDANYELPKPIRGDLDIDADVRAGAEDWFGTREDLQVQIVALDDVDIATEQRGRVTPSVRIEGHAAVGVGNYMLENTLPPGRYLFRIRVVGTGNWDRQTVYVVVEGE